ncbi:hypothetical protein WJX81_005107 [Elliptochloris bilobata]|uniref:Beta-galactosidase n=1 Tax=Elliptochloris bilobata TaxID=381761 RepID=A0AAW1QYC3_9CHLO
MRCLMLRLLAAIPAIASVQATHNATRTFTITNDRFIKDGDGFQIISGSIHYFRIHPSQWEDRLLRLKAMGLNTVQTYVPWNLHEARPGELVWHGFADLERFLRLAHAASLLVLLRPGPYICAEWDFGGLPWWIASSQVAGGGAMKYRTSDPVYLAHVDRWWRPLLAKVQPLLYQNGGPVVMVQIENEFGFYGPDEAYLRHLVGLARSVLGNDVVLYTTDPPPYIANGTLPGDALFSTVDFGPGWYNLSYAFGQQQALMNAPGRRAPLNSEYYTGWLTWVGQDIANKSVAKMVKHFREILAYANGTGSVNLYMAAGGTNFGFTAGGQLDYLTDKVAWREGLRGPPDLYRPVITSYDYGSPLSESGETGQPGLGGPNGFKLLRAAIAEHTGREPPPLPPPPCLEAYGTVEVPQQAPLLSQLPHWFPGGGLPSDTPLVMEEYGQQGGVILYRMYVPASSAVPGATLHLGGAVHDVAQVLVNGRRVGSFDRNGFTTLTLPPGTPGPADGLLFAGTGANPYPNAVLDILVSAVGRQNSRTDYDTKGLSSPDVFLNDLPLTGGWNGPVLYRGLLHVDSGLVGSDGLLPSTYLSIKADWSFGLAYINGFNLGWYAADRGPANTLYVPGALLAPCANEVVLLEMNRTSYTPAGPTPAVRFVAAPDFSGPRGAPAPATAPAPPTSAFGGIVFPGGHQVSLQHQGSTA